MRCSCVGCHQVNMGLPLSSSSSLTMSFCMMGRMGLHIDGIPEERDCKYTGGMTY